MQIFKKREVLCGIVIAILFLFLFYNQYSESKYGKSAFATFNDLKTFTQQEVEWLENKKTIYYGIHGNCAPLEFVDENHGICKGVIPDYIHALSKELGVEIKPITLKNSEDAYRLLKEQKIDILGMIPDVSNKDSYLYTYPILRIRGAIIVPLMGTEKGILKDFNQISNVAILAKDDTYNFLNKNTANIEQKKVLNMENAIDEIQKNRVEGVAGMEIILQQELKRLGLEESFRFINYPGYESNYVFVTDRSSHMLRQILNKGIHNLQSKNILEDIQRKWFGISLPLARENISDRIALIIVIVFISISLVLYYFYISNKTLFRELEERMEELNISRNELQITFDSLTHLMIVVDQFFMILNTNAEMCKYLKRHESDIVGKYFIQFMELEPFFSEDMHENFKKVFEEGQARQQEIAYGGKIFEINIFPVKDYREQISKVLIMIKDITQMHMNERQLLQENKMAAIGQLAAGIAHEIRNPLGLIRNYCYILKNEMEAKTQLMSKAIGNIEISVQKAGLIIDNLLNFSRISNEKWEEVNLKDYMDMVLLLHDNELKKNGIYVQLDCDSYLQCKVNAGALEIILVNLIANAIDAMPYGGDLYLKCNVRGNFLQLICQDTGIGIESDQLSKIFEPFFTTKDKKKGTGLGLYLAYNEIQKWGGKIRVNSKLGEGTTFNITLPLCVEGMI